MPRVCVIGSANVDYTVALSRLPSPGETVSGGELLVNLGGKGANQAVAARRLGGEVRMIGCVGDDAGGRRDVARHRHRSAHHDDAGGLGQAPSITPERQGDVGERSQGDHHETPGEAIRRLENQIGPVQHLKGMRGLWVPGPPVGLTEAAEVAETVVTVDMGRRDERAHERGVGAPRHSRTVAGARHVEDAEGVGGAEVDLDIARHRGDGLHRDFGRVESQENGKGVVDAGIGVDEDGNGQLTLRNGLRIIPGGGNPIERRRIG